MSDCPHCQATVPAGRRFCAICRRNVYSGTARMASPGKRLGATILDSIIPFFALFTIFGAAAATGGSDGSIMLALLLFLGYAGFAFYLFAMGTTPGKKVLGMTVVGESGQHAGFGRMFIREWIGKWISGLVFGLGFLWILFDAEKQGWHDKLVSTFVVD